MVGGYQGRVDLPAGGTKRHDGRPSGAILLAQRRRDDADDLGVLGEDQPERIVEAAARVHLARAHQLVADLDRLEKFSEQPDHVRGEAWMALAERVGNPRYRLAQKARGRLAVGNAFGDLAQAVHVVDENDEAAWTAKRGVLRIGFAEHFEGMLDVGGAQHLAHRAEMRQTRRTEAAFEDHFALSRVAADPLGEPAGLFIGPKVEFGALAGRHQSSSPVGITRRNPCPR